MYDLEEALAHPETLDGPGVLPLDALSGEVESATFLDDERVLVATSGVAGEDAISVIELSA